MYEAFTLISLILLEFLLLVDHEQNAWSIVCNCNFSLVSHLHLLLNKSLVIVEQEYFCTPKLAKAMS